MALSVRMDPLLERELEHEAKRRGISKSQFVVDAVERALGRRDPYASLLAIRAEEEAAAPYRSDDAGYGGAAKARKAIASRLRAKHGAGGAR